MTFPRSVGKEREKREVTRRRPRQREHGEWGSSGKRVSLGWWLHLVSHLKGEASIAKKKKANKKNIKLQCVCPQGHPVAMTDLLESAIRPQAWQLYRHL